MKEILHSFQTWLRSGPILHRYNFYLNGGTIQAILKQIFNTIISTKQNTFTDQQSKMLLLLLLTYMKTFSDNIAQLNDKIDYISEKLFSLEKETRRNLMKSRVNCVLKLPPHLVRVWRIELTK